MAKCWGTKQRLIPKNLLMLVGTYPHLPGALFRPMRPHSPQAFEYVSRHLEASGKVSINSPLSLALNVSYTGEDLLILEVAVSQCKRLLILPSIYDHLNPFTSSY